MLEQDEKKTTPKKEERRRKGGKRSVGILSSSPHGINHYERILFHLIDMNGFMITDFTVTIFGLELAIPEPIEHTKKHPKRITNTKKRPIIEHT